MSAGFSALTSSLAVSAFGCSVTVGVLASSLTGAVFFSSTTGLVSEFSSLAVGAERTLPGTGFTGLAISEAVSVLTFSALAVSDFFSATFSEESAFTSATILEVDFVSLAVVEPPPTFTSTFREEDGLLSEPLFEFCSELLVCVCPETGSEKCVPAVTFTVGACTSGAVVGDFFSSLTVADGALVVGLDGCPVFVRIGVV